MADDAGGEFAEGVHCGAFIQLKQMKLYPCQGEIAN